MPTARRKIAGDPILSEEDLRDLVIVVTGESNPRTPQERGAAVAADPLGKRFETADSPEEMAEQGDREATFAHEERTKRRQDYAAQALGDAFDRSQPFDLSPGEWGTMFDVARSKNEIHRQEKFRRGFGPDAELTAVSDPEAGRTLYARRSSRDPWREVPSSPETASAFISGPGVLGLAAKTVPQAVLLTGAGVFADEAIETFRGFPNEGSIGSLAGQAIREGGIAGVLTAGIGAISKTPALFGHGTSPHPAVKAAAEEGFVPLSVGQMTDSAMTKAMVAQVSRVGIVTNQMTKLTASQKKSALDAAERYAAAGGELTDDMVREVREAQKAKLEEMLTPEAISRAGAAQKLQDGIVLHDKIEQATIRGLYRDVSDLGKDIVLDIRKSVKLVEDQKKSFHLELKRKASENQHPDLPPQGPAPHESTLPKFAGELGSIMDLLSRADPIMRKVTTPAGEWSAFENLKQIRTRLWHVKNEADEGLVRKYANDLYKSLTEDMASPVGGNPAFVTAWQKASAAHFVHESNMEKLFIAKIVASAEKNGPLALESVAAPYFKPGHLTELKTFKDLLPAESWKGLQDAFQMDLIAGGSMSATKARIDDFMRVDKDSFNLLVPSDRLSSLKHYIAQREAFEGSALAVLEKTNKTAREKLDFILTTGGESAMKDLIELSGGKGSPTAAAVKSAVYKTLAGVDEILPSGEKGMDPRRVLPKMREIEDSHVLDHLFTDADWKTFENFRQYNFRVLQTTDPGVSIQAAEVGAQALRIPSDTLFGFAKKALEGPVRKVVEAEMWAGVMASPVAYRAATEASAPFARRMANALAIVNTEYEARRSDWENRRKQ